MKVKEIPVLYNDKDLCCGCMACFSICPIQAIEMQFDTEGFLYPEIDSEKCICCHKCKNACPIKE